MSNEIEEEQKRDRAAERLEFLINNSNMPANTLTTHTMATFKASAGTRQAYNAALAFLAEENLTLGVGREHHFLTYVGEVGRGKTHLALGIGWEWINNRRRMARYWQVSELLDAMRQEYDNPPRDSYGHIQKGVFEQCKGAGLLILDDLGVEKSTEWAVDKLDTLINHRWLEEKLTVFTTNLEPSQLQPRIRSRLKEGVVVTLDGVDYREYKAKRRVVDKT